MNSNKPEENHLTQSSFIRQYNDKYREEFNDQLFYRSDDDIIDQIKKVIISCQRNRYFTIRVDKFTVVDDYSEIRKLLTDQENFKSRNRKDKTMGNKYEYITLKDSEIRLLVVDYFIKVENPNLEDPEKVSKDLRVIIEVPKIVDKYYFKIFGNIYSSMYQIVDGSTYNNSQSNSKSQSVALKTLFMATRLYRWMETIKCTNGESIKCILYSSRIFNKPIPIMKYLLARYGLFNFQHIIKVPELMITDYDPKTNDKFDSYNFYTVKKNNMYVSLPKFIFDNDATAQSLFATVISSINKDTNINNVFTNAYWVGSLGESYGNRSEEKGSSILDSLESILDIATKESLRLPDNDKENIYTVLVWAIREFTELRQKDNLDVSTKRLRFAEYIAALYAMKLSKGLYRIADEGSKVQLSSIEKAIYTFPDYLLKMITKDSLINYKNSVNDLDALAALKFTYKGVSGPGEKNTSIPVSYRQVHPSHVGRLDMDSSSATDPGLSGTICPLVDIYDNHFTDYQEPNDWRDKTDIMLSEYRNLLGLKQALIFENEIGLDIDPVRVGMVDEMIDLSKKLIRPFVYL